MRPRFFAALAACAAIVAHAQPMVFVMDPFPPFTYEENGVAKGPFADTIRAVCREIRVSCRFETYPWRRALAMAESGQVDGIYALAHIPEREEHFFLSRPIVRSAYGVFAPRRSSFRYSAPADLAGYTIGVYGPSAASAALEKVAAGVPGVSIVMEIDNTTLLKKLGGERYGDRGVAVANVDVGTHLVRLHDIANLEVVGELAKIEYTVGLSRKKASPGRAAEFDAALGRLVRSGKVRQIVEGYRLKAAP